MACTDFLIWQACMYNNQFQHGSKKYSNLCSIIKFLYDYLHMYDKQSIFVQTFRLLHEEGFFVGASSGLNVSAAVKVCMHLT